jgi:pimeloyl-ACP methyl ester carboxylesterase
MPDILANGVRIHYEERGSGPAMIWAHGLGGICQDWEGTMNFFQDRYRVIAYDARGHGRSEILDLPEAYSQDIMVEDMRGVMEVLGVARVVVGGHSMGANVALNFGLKYPEQCLGLIPVGIGSGSSDAEWWCDYWGQLADVAEQQGMAAFLEEMKKLPAWGSAFADSKMGKQISQTELANSPRAIAHTIRGVQQKRPSIFQLADKLEKLPVPTEILPAMSHWTHLEAAEAFLQAVDSFVSRLAT